LDESVGLRADLYALTMMQGYWARGRREDWGAFDLFFRSVPEGGGYCIAAGIEDALDLVERMQFTPEDLDYLRSLGLFQEDFLQFLRSLRFRGEIRCVPEGAVVFPNEPLLEVCGPLPEAQWIESILLNCVNFQTLAATKARRIVESAAPASVVEFGLRRAQGPNGALWASRASFLAGVAGTSNLEAGRAYGIPVYGTHAHSWVQSFESEAEAFRAYSETFPDHAILLIDTYDALGSGLAGAVQEAKRLAASGRRLAGVRLDSGDLAYLSKECRRRLDAEGLEYVKIVASSDIDEYLLQDLKVQGAPIDVYGVGTRLATAFGEPALGGVYKLTAIRRGGEWEAKIKISSNPSKTTLPGRKQIYRWESDGRYLGDALALLEEPPPSWMRHPDVEFKQTSLAPAELRPLLTLRWDGEGRVGGRESLADSRRRVEEEMQKLPAEHKRLANPHTYRVGVSAGLYNLRKSMIAQRTTG
jgi:nicotinate phosphoribosyltransferase